MSDTECDTDIVYALNELLNGEAATSSLTNVILEQAEKELRRLYRGLARLAERAGVEVPSPWDTVTMLDRIEHRIQVLRTEGSVAKEVGAEMVKQATLAPGLAAAIDKVLSVKYGEQSAYCNPELQIIRGPDGKRWRATLELVGSPLQRVTLRAEEGATLAEAVDAMAAKMAPT